MKHAAKKVNVLGERLYPIVEVALFSIVKMRDEVSDAVETQVRRVVRRPIEQLLSPMGGPFTTP